MTESPTVIAVATAVIVIGQVVQQWLNWKTGLRAQADAKHVRDAAAGVRQDLLASNATSFHKQDTIIAQGGRIEKLVNNRTSVMLKRIAEYAEAEAARTGKPEDVRAAELARQESDNHERIQNNMDAAREGGGR